MKIHCQTCSSHIKLPTLTGFSHFFMSLCGSVTSSFSNVQGWCFIKFLEESLESGHFCPPEFL